MIHTKNLSKIFRTDEVETNALLNVDLTIEQGEFVAIMGPSGCGKSTLLNILGLLDTPSRGDYYFNQVNMTRFNENQRINIRKGRIGFVFQNFNLIDELSIFENVEFPLIPLKISLSNRKKCVNDILNCLKIGHRSKHFPQQLSGGQQQRVAIARALVIRPDLILADEPTGNLDSKHGLEVMKMLRELNKEGTAIVIATHNNRDAEFAHRIVNLFDGQIVHEN
ncbi:MAG: ABC transporter ATP-binding protein [Bacteroidales bacterium]|nr:ABC transporter ATP-binding protein [Bacteroidales bacterium]